ncbi:MAG: chorismate synthase [Ruminococcaceae bacterium]|nr:chorismate synthase [Oscillospiraceae bacterium]
MTTYGKNIKISIYGGSHDPEIGVYAEGVPKGIKIDLTKLRSFMERRAPGRNKFSTQRKEGDVPVFLSGVDEISDKEVSTNGETLHAVIYSSNMRSGDYSNLAEVPRPSHADFAARMKYGDSVDLRGGGHFSGRLTAPLCIIGGICLQYLESTGIRIGAHIASIGEVKDIPFDPLSPDRALFDLVAEKEFPAIDDGAEAEMRALIEAARMDGDSVGGVIECAAVGIPMGLGEHMFDGMEGRISAMVFSIPAVKGIEFGLGFGSSMLRGSENNDPFVTDGRTVRTSTNNCGGIQGGMTNGMPLVFRAAMKPTPSIGKEQNSVNLSTMENVRLTISGRHDPCVVPRAVPVFEAALAIVLCDAMLDHKEAET